MGFIDITETQLNALSVPHAVWDLDTSVKLGHRILGGIEPLELCWAEDKHRARALRALPPKFLAAQGLHPFGTAQILEESAVAKRILVRSLASAAYIRERRLALLCAVLKLSQDNPDIESALVSITHPGWRRGLTTPWGLGGIGRRLRIGLRYIAGLPGYLVAYLNRVFDPNTQEVQFSYRAICAGAKLSYLRLISEQRKGARGAEVVIHQASDLPRAIFRMMPNHIPGGTRASAANGMMPRRWRQPHHSIYLMRLDKYSLSDFCVFDGACFQNGQLVIVDS